MALSIEDFTKLMLVQLAKNSYKIHFRRFKKCNSADIPFNYRERIENILCMDNGWKEEFSILIDIDEYFKNHFIWEENLAREIQKFAEKPGNKIDYHIVNEYISVTIKPDYIDEVLNSFDENTNKVMIHFVNLLTSHIFGRRHQEEICDYSARSVAKMHEYFENMINSFIR